MPLPKAIRRLTPARVRDDPRLRALAVGTGVIPPRVMHSDGEAALLADLARGRRRVVEIGVFEGSSAVVLCDVLDPGAELHRVDPFGHHPSALREGAAATEWATRRVVDRATRRTNGPRVQWHVDFSASVAERWTLPVASDPNWGAAKCRSGLDASSFWSSFRVSSRDVSRQKGGVGFGVSAFC